MGGYELFNDPARLVEVFDQGEMFVQGSLSSYVYVF